MNSKHQRQTLNKVISFLFESSWDKETIRLVQTLTQKETGNMFICLFIISNMWGI